MSKKVYKESLERLDFVPTLNLDELMDETNSSREKLQLLNADLEDFSSELKGFIKVLGHYEESGREFARCQRQLADKLFSIRIRPQETYQQRQFQSVISSLHRSLSQQARLLDLMLDKTHLYLYKPMEYYLHTEIDEVKSLRKYYERSRESYQSVAEKMSSYTHSQTSSSMVKKEKVRLETEESKVTFVRATFDYACKINDLEKRKQFEFIEFMESLMRTEMLYHKESYAELESMDALRKEAKEFCQKERDEWNALTNDSISKRKAHLSRLNESADSISLSKKIETEGYLFKKSRNLSMKEWKRRYFIIENGKMFYQRNQKDNSSRGFINLLLTTVKEVNTPEIPNTFEVISNEYSYLLQAESPEEMKEWITTIQNAIAHELSRQNTNDSSRIEVSGNNDALGRIRQHDELNNLCADCNMAEPDWVSINLGCVLCIQCSGIHRSLGVHVSKVRSLLLDRCDQDTLQFLLVTGNKFVNSIWENQLNQTEKPTPASSRSNKETFISNKYVHRQYISPIINREKPLGDQLYDAVMTKSFPTCYRLVSQGAPVEHHPKSTQHPTLVAAAIQQEELTIADLLLLNDAPTCTTPHNTKSKQQSDSENLAFTYAVQSQKLDSLRVLFRRGRPESRPSVHLLTQLASELEWHLGVKYIRAILIHGVDLDISQSSLEKLSLPEVDHHHHGHHHTTPAGPDLHTSQTSANHESSLNSSITPPTSSSAFSPNPKVKSSHHASSRKADTNLAEKLEKLEKLEKVDKADKSEKADAPQSPRWFPVSSSILSPSVPPATTHHQSVSPVPSFLVSANQSSQIPASSQSQSQSQSQSPRGNPETLPSFTSEAPQISSLFSHRRRATLSVSNPSSMLPPQNSSSNSPAIGHSPFQTKAQIMNPASHSGPQGSAPPQSAPSNPIPIAGENSGQFTSKTKERETSKTTTGQSPTQSPAVQTFGQGLSTLDEGREDETGSKTKGSHPSGFTKLFNRLGN